jgi:23S rRNA (pseudouridine1915-N3)-methyltransferase
MKIKIVAVGTKMPDWVTQGVHEFTRRLPHELAIEWREIPVVHRSKTLSLDALIKKESDVITSHLTPKEYCILLDVKGKAYSTKALALQWERWKTNHSSITFIIGGPNGVSEELVNRSNQRWSLSELTFPHPLVRLLLIEQLYRVWSLSLNHPYHK